MALKVKEKRASEEKIYEEGEVPQKMFILMKGRLERVLSKRNNSLQNTHLQQERK